MAASTSKSRTPEAGLEISGLTTGYGSLPILRDVSLRAPSGRISGIVGGNGSGKTTLLKAIAGLLPIWEGQVRVAGVDITHRSAAMRIRSGLGVLTGDAVFPDLTVAEHLELMRPRVPDDRSFAGRRATMLELFPLLADRHQQPAGTLSGGERQMLGLARALLPDPPLILVDELSLGLQPSVVGEIYELLPSLAREQGTTFCVVEQHPAAILRISDEIHVLVSGEVAYSGAAAPFAKDPGRLVALYLRRPPPARSSDPGVT